MPSNLTRHNGATIRAFRVKAGKKVKDLAAEAKCSWQQLDNIENERKEASLELLNRLAAVLEVPVVALVRDPVYALHPSDRLAS